MRSFFAMICLLTGQAWGGVQICSGPDPDQDSDGWGWENDASCIEQLPNLSVPALYLELQRVCLEDLDLDADGWGWEDSQSCVTVEALEIDVSESVSIDRDINGVPVCSSQSVDADGDGWGYENRRSCRFGAEGVTVSTGSIYTPIVLPVDQSDGEGEYGATQATEVIAEAIEGDSRSGDQLDQSQPLEDLAESNPDLRICDPGESVNISSFTLINDVFGSEALLNLDSSQCIETIGSMVRWRYNYPYPADVLSAYPRIELEVGQSHLLPELVFSYTRQGNDQTSGVKFSAFFSEKCTDAEITYQLDIWLSPVSQSADVPTSADSIIVDNTSYQILSLDAGWNGVTLVALKPMRTGLLNLQQYASWLQDDVISHGLPVLSAGACLVKTSIGTPIRHGFGIFDLSSFGVRY